MGGRKRSGQSIRDLAAVQSSTMWREMSGIECLHRSLGSLAAVEAWLGSLGVEMQAQVPWEWELLWARPSQREPDAIRAGTQWLWMIKTGRGWGKNRTAAEVVAKRIREGRNRRGIIIGRTPSEVQNSLLEDPESGLLHVGPPEGRPSYSVSKREVRWPNGAVALVRSGAEPEGPRGINAEFFWADEIASWEYPDEAWSNAVLATRKGEVLTIVTTTPKPIGKVLDLLDQCDRGHGVLTEGITMDNKANLSDAFFTEIRRQYAGTRTWEQEVLGRVLREAEGSLWTRDEIDAHRVDEVPPLEIVAVGIDPAAKSKRVSNETGIIVAGRGVDKQGYVLADGSGRYTPQVWASRAINLLREYEGAWIVYEANQGGEMCVSTLRTVDMHVALKEVHASSNKAARAEPVAALYQQGRVHHVGRFEALETEMVTWEPYDDRYPDSPNRVDALVWVLRKLMQIGRKPIVVAAPSVQWAPSWSAI